MELSIIIPVYNGAATIGRCLDSIFSQDLEESQYEVICVDDCSPEPSSVSAIENYEYQGIHPPNLILIKLDVNKRPGGARNTGVRAAKGDWIEFVDCDDYLVKDSLKKLLNVMYSYQNIELVHFCCLIGTETKITERCNRGGQAAQIMTGADYHIKGNGPSTPWMCLFKRSVFFNKNLWFEENVRFEDVDFVIKFNVLARKAMFVPVCVYYYIKHEGQTTDIGNDIGKIKELYLCTNRMASNAKEFMETRQYRTNGECLMHYAALDRIAYTKRDLWKIGFKDRITVLKDVRLSFCTGYKAADFIYNHPIITSLLLIPMNQTLLNMLIKGKKYIKSLFSK